MCQIRKAEEIGLKRVGVYIVFRQNLNVNVVILPLLVLVVVLFFVGQEGSSMKNPVKRSVSEAM